MDGKTPQIAVTAQHERLFQVLWVLWLVCGIFLAAVWLVSIPPFLHGADTGTLPEVVIDGVSASAMAAENEDQWGISVPVWARISLVINGFSLAVFSLIAGLIWWRVRSGFGLLTAYVLLLGGSAAMGTAIYGAGLPYWVITLWGIGALVWPLFFLWLFLFPNGVAVPRALLWIILPVLGLFTTFFIASILEQFLVDAPVLARVTLAFEPFGVALVAFLFVLVLCAQIYRYVKVSSPLAREQTKSFLFGLLLAFIPLMIVDFFLDYPDELNTIAFTALPVGIGVSILRYRLWDVDVIIRNSLLYGLLTAVIVAVYFALVLIGQSDFVALTGQESPLAIVISILAIATLFNPLRRRIQAFIDHRFFRSRYDAQLVLAEFGRLAGREVEIDALTTELQGAIQQTLQPSAITIWLKEHDAR